MPGSGLRRPLRSTRTTGCPASPHLGRVSLPHAAREVSDSAAMASVASPRLMFIAILLVSFLRRALRHGSHLVVLKRFDDVRAIPRSVWIRRISPGLFVCSVSSETVISSLKRFDYPYEIMLPCDSVRPLCLPVIAGKSILFRRTPLPQRICVASARVR